MKETSMADEAIGTFTAHNVCLDDGTQTLPSMGYTMDQNPVTRCVQRLMAALYPNGVQGKSIVDVGCLEGGFTTEFARMGMESTGIEVRESNYNNCLYVRERVNLPNLHFFQGDANDIAKFGKFDVFFVSGLLYHLDKPRKFLEDVARNCGKALILWTHVTHAEENEASRTYSLSTLTENEGLQGRWYSEHGDIPKNELDLLKWASWDNAKSFWIQKEYLLQTLRDLGFDLVFEQFDCMDDIIGDMTEGFYHKIDRVMLVAIKSGLPGEQSDRARKRRIVPAGTGGRTAPAIGQGAVWQTSSSAEKMLEAVYASTSWRITSPLRLLGGLLRPRS
jgi:SAM-dependent methyltransferase